ncbi:PAS domain-containing protein [Chloroflexota bacterium]
MVSDNNKTNEQLLIELANMRQRITELEESSSVRRKTEELLRETEERWRVLFELSRDGYYLSDLKGNFIDGNKAAEEAIGYNKEELIGKSFLKLDLLSVKQIPKAMELLTRNAMGKDTGPDEFLLKRKDNSQVTVEISTFPVKLNNKTVVLGIVHNTGEPRRLEQILHEREQQLSLILDNIDDAIIHLDETGKIIAVNKRAEEIFGYKPEEVTGRNFTKLGIGSPKDLPTIARLFSEVLKGDVSQLIELESKRKDGSKIAIEATIKVAREQNRIECIIAIIRDITERKLLQERDK